MLSKELRTEVLKDYPVDGQNAVWFKALDPFEVDGIVYDYFKNMGCVSQPMFDLKPDEY